MSPLRAAVLLAVLSGAGDARAFVRTTTDDGLPLFWDSPIVPYVVNTARLDPAQTRESPTCRVTDGVDRALEAVRAGFDAWHQPCSHLRLTLAGATEDVRVGETGSEQNLVVFREGFCSANAQARVDPCFTRADIDCGNLFNCFEDVGGDRSTLALTSVLFRPSTGRIVDADMEIVGWNGQVAGTTLPGGDPQHGWYFTCADPAAVANRECTTYGQEGCYYVDLQNTVAHEAGHFIGLRHPCDGGSRNDADLPACRAADQVTTMYPRSFAGDFEKRSLDADDVAGVCAAYPEDDGGCGCGSGGPPGVIEIAALLALAALRPWRRRAR